MGICLCWRFSESPPPTYKWHCHVVAFVTKGMNICVSTIQQRYSLWHYSIVYSEIQTSFVVQDINISYSQVLLSLVGSQIQKASDWRGRILGHQRSLAIIHGAHWMEIDTVLTLSICSAHVLTFLNLSNVNNHFGNRDIFLTPTPHSYFQYTIMTEQTSQQTQYVNNI